MKLNLKPNGNTFNFDIQLTLDRNLDYNFEIQVQSLNGDMLPKTLVPIQLKEEINEPVPEDFVKVQEEPQFEEQKQDLPEEQSYGQEDQQQYDDNQIN